MRKKKSYNTCHCQNEDGTIERKLTKSCDRACLLFTDAGEAEQEKERRRRRDAEKERRQTRF
ncbi:unnamed protein product [Brassica rapa subsp. narinosa]